MNHTFKKGDKVRIAPDLPKHIIKFSRNDGSIFFWIERKRFAGVQRIRAIVGDAIFVGSNNTMYCAEMLVKA